MTKNVSSPAQRTIQQAWTAYNASKYADALKLARAAKRIAGTLPEPYYIESLCLSGMNHSEEAKRLAEVGMKRFPNHPGFLGLVGALEVALENYTAGIPLLQRSLELQPGSAQLWQVLGTAMFYTGDYFEARLAGEKAAALLPNDPVAVGNYASALRESGSTIEAIPVFRRACALDPLQRVNRSNLLFSLLYDETIGAEELRREATDWARTLARTLVEAPALRASEGERIRIGILSNDLRRHACAYFLIPLIANLDRTRFEVHLFSLSNVNDNITKKIRVYAEGFHDLYKMSEADVVKAVRAQRCDVMVDLGGYTGASAPDLHGASPGPEAADVAGLPRHHWHGADRVPRDRLDRRSGGLRPQLHGEAAPCARVQRLPPDRHQPAEDLRPAIPRAADPGAEQRLHHLRLLQHHRQAGPQDHAPVERRAGTLPERPYARRSHRLRPRQRARDALRAHGGPWHRHQPRGADQP